MAIGSKHVTLIDTSSLLNAKAFSVSSHNFEFLLANVVSLKLFGKFLGPACEQIVDCMHHHRRNEKYCSGK